MNFEKLLLIFIIHFALFFVGCGQKGKKILTIEKESYTNIKEINQTEKEQSIEMKLLQKIDKTCHIKTTHNKNNTFEISLDEEDNFEKFSDKLSSKSQKKLLCITDVLLTNPKQLYILITGYASESSSPAGNEYLSANRAITVAELFYAHGIRDEIFAKGCSDKNHIAQREVKIFIYPDKSKIKNNCK